MFHPNNEYDTNKFNSSNHDPYNDNNFASVNSRMMKVSEFNSVQNDFNYNIQMGFTSKISSLVKNVKFTQNTEETNFLLSRMQELEKYEDQSFKLEFPFKMIANSKISWLSPKDFLNDETTLFPKDSNGAFLPCDLNNNSFTSAMNLMLSNPSLLSRLFETDQINLPGIYGIWLCEAGVWKLVIVDDRVPTLNSSYAFNEFECKEKCIFHMIVQKAMAKLNKGYETLGKLSICSMMNQLTGGHVEVKNLMEAQTNEDLWALIKKWRDANFMIFLQNQHEEDRDLNIEVEEGLAYSVVDCIELIMNDSDQSIMKILRLKSPVKGKLLQGKYNKNNSGLTIEEKKRLKIGNAATDDAYFCLTLEECMGFFTDIGVCKAQNKINAAYNCTIVKNQESFVTKLHLNAPGSIVISISQGERSHNIRAMLTKDDMKFLAADYSNRNIFFERNDLDSGDFTLVVEIAWSDTLNKEVTIGCMCDNEVMTQEMNFEVIPKKNSDILELQKTLLKDYAKSKLSNTMRIRDYSSSGEPSIKIYNDMVFGLSYFYYINQSNKKLKEVIAMQTLKNLNICAPFKDNMSFDIELDPNDEIIVVYKYDKNGKDFSYSLTIKASLERANSIVSSSQINYESSEIKLNASKMNSSSVVLSEQNPKDELFRLIQQRGTMKKRVWKNHEVEVLVYTCVHKEGLAMLYCNKTWQKFSETIHLVEMKNLEYYNKDTQVNSKKIEVEVEPQKCEMLLFNRQMKQEFTFKFKQTYKLE